MQASELMSTNLVVVPPETPITAIAELLAARGISAVPVVDEQGKPLGIVTEGDLIRRLAEKPRGRLTWFLDLFRGTAPQVQRFTKAHGKTARDVMTTNLIAVQETATTEEVACLMEEHAIRRVPVLKDGKMVGLVSRADLLRAILRPPTSAPAQRDDAAIMRSVVARMREQPWIDNFWVFPYVEGGKVTLHGFVRSEAVRQGLGVLAREVPGVTTVEDKMEPMPRFLRRAL
jgi:CBS domain-containing protein